VGYNTAVADNVGLSSFV